MSPPIDKCSCSKTFGGAGGHQFSAENAFSQDPSPIIQINVNLRTYEGIVIPDG